mmetsp:Transcript_35907/g.75539  ORF Transcript_35907/g.75539 Transcript_35907/m.75539 type:complete len:234 (+) Transcript_35907:125-826(+)
MLLYLLLLIQLLHLLSQLVQPYFRLVERALMFWAKHAAMHPNVTSCHFASFHGFGEILESLAVLNVGDRGLRGLLVGGRSRVTLHGAHGYIAFAHPPRMSNVLLLRRRVDVDHVRLKLLLLMLVRARTRRAVAFAWMGVAVDATGRKVSLIFLFLVGITTFERFELKVHFGRSYQVFDDAAKVLVKADVKKAISISTIFIEDEIEVVEVADLRFGDCRVVVVIAVDRSRSGHG